MADDPEKNETPEINAESIGETPIEDLSDDQKIFIKENPDDLSDEQKETFKEVLEEKEEDVDPTKVKVKTRVKTKKPKEGEEEEEEEEEVDPDDKETIGKVVKKSIKPLEDKLAAQTERSQKLADEAEVDAHIRDNPELKKYRGVILKHMKHPSYSNIPAANVAAMVAAEDQQKIGAEKEREAAKKAKDTQGGGTTVRKPKAGEIDWSKASKKDIAAKRQEILDQSRE